MQMFFPLVFDQVGILAFISCCLLSHVSCVNWPHGVDQNSNFSKRHEGIFGSEDVFLVLVGLDSAQLYVFVYVCEVLGVRKAATES